MAEMKLVIGDILTNNESNEDVVVCHQVNCQGVMGAGLAKQVKKKHPRVYADYKEKCDLIKSGEGGLGDVLFSSCLNDSGYVIANIFGQYAWGRGLDRCGNRVRYTDYGALRKAFAEIARIFPDSTVRIPWYMGCGLGGGDWSVIEEIIHETLVKRGINVEIWQYSV